MAKLYLVPTPVGNLEDITLRAIRILKEADTILAEDTRTSSKLLHHYGIETKLQSHHKFNEHKTSEHIAERILGGETIALITDAGTPGISDPGFLLVRTCAEKGVDIETQIIQGEISSDGILKAVEELGSDLIVIGSHGRKGFQKLILGSFAQDVLNSTKIQVLVVKE